jgi:hypothetical protein
MPREVTNPELLALLEEEDDKAVVDPALLAALEGPQEPGATGAGTPRSGQRWLLDKAMSAIKGIPSGVQDLSEGIGVSGLKTYYGLKDLVGMGEESDRETLKAWQDAAGESFMGAGGEMIGDAAQMMLPGGGVASKGARAATMLGDVAAGTALGAVQLPGEGQTRTGNATMMAAGGAGGHVLGKALGVPLVGMRGTPASERMRDMGAELTPGQLKEGIPRRVESLAEYILPSVSKAIKTAKEKSQLTTNKALLNRAKPAIAERAPVDMADLNKMWNEAYETAWPGVEVLNTKEGYDGIVKAMSNAIRTQKTDKKIAAMNRVADDVAAIINTPGTSLAEVDALLREQLRYKKRGTSRVWDKAIQEVRDAFVSAMPAENRSLLRQLNRDYGKRSAVGAGMRTANALETGIMKPKDLRSGVRQTSTKRSLEEGRGNLQQEMQDWIEVEGPKLGILPSAMRRFVQGFPEPGRILVRAADRAAGNLPSQRARREMLKRNPVLRRALQAGKAGAAGAKQLKEKLEEED